MTEEIYEKGRVWGMNNKRDNLKRRRYNTNVLLLAVMIGFCILAIIEIIYGQVQIRLQRQRLALEQENHQTVQELKEEWDQLKGEPNVGAEAPATAGEEQAGNGEPEKILTNEEQLQEEQPQDTPAPTEGDSSDAAAAVSANDVDDKQYDMQIVFMGDSILDNERENHGVAGLISDGCNARVYNMSMGGTSAALLPGDQISFDTWDSRCLLGIVYAILGKIDTNIFEGYRAGEILKDCDFSKTDYFVIEYGINDFLSQKIPQSRYMEDGSTLNIDTGRTYSGALQTAVDLLHANFPNAKILLIAPHYCQIFSGNTFVGDAYSVSYGYGTLVEFSRCTGYVYEQNKDKNVLLFNAMEDSGINAYTADKYLEDGIHLTTEGRIEYADHLIRMIRGDFYPEE